MALAACASSPPSDPVVVVSAPKITQPELGNEEPNAAGEVDEGLQRPTGSSSALTAFDLRPRLLDSTYSGELCPNGSLEVSAGESNAVSIHFSTDLNAEEEGDVAKSCQVTLTLDVPAGHTFGNVYLNGLGYAAEPEGTAAIDVAYSFKGSGTAQHMSRSFAADQGSPYVLYKVMDQVWAPSCDSSGHPVELVLDIEASANGRAHLNLGSVEFGLSYIDGAQWKSCADGSLVKPPPSEEGGPCGGLSRHPCDDKSECDIFDARHDADELLFGMCVNRNEKLPAQPKFGPCGGVRDIQCLSNFCHYHSETRRTKDVVGFCADATGEVGDACDGVPSVTCGPGLFCSPDSRDTCKAGDGALGGGCEEGVVDCGAGMVCQNGLCERKRVENGAPCGGPEKVKCDLMLTCDADTLHCKPDPAFSGELGSRCGSRAPCKGTLMCLGMICRESNAGLFGSECATHADCADLLGCSKDGTCALGFRGGPGQPCFGDGTCSSDYVCDGSTCVAPPKPPVDGDADEGKRSDGADEASDTDVADDVEDTEVGDSSDDRTTTLVR